MHDARTGLSAQHHSRRRLLQTLAAGVFAGVMAPLFRLLPAAHAAVAVTGTTKVLIVYYSRSGNTQAVAAHIQEATGGDMVQLHTVHPYPDDYKATTRQAQAELKSGFKPPLTTHISNIEAYDVVFIGSPNWWGTIAAPMKTFLSEHPLPGKKVVPFITHEGSQLGRSITDIAALCPNATLLEGLAVRGKSAQNARNEVAAWLNRLGL